WYNHGADLNNSRSATGGTINSTSVGFGSLKLKWKFQAGLDVSATPAIYNGVIYFPCWNGNIYAVNAITGTLVWMKSVGALTGVPSPNILTSVTVARATPTVVTDGYNLLVWGIYGPAVAFAVSITTGKLAWMTALDPSNYSVVTASGTYYSGAYYVGLSSLDEMLPESMCCTFRGSMVKMNVRTGKIQWQTYTLPDNGGNMGGYAGAAIWGSSPPIDINRGVIYAATGNLYSAPASVVNCEVQTSQAQNATNPDSCVPSNIYFNSFIAFDMTSGGVIWGTRMGGYDGPGLPSPDADFGEAPMLITAAVNGSQVDMVVAVQKSGYAYALNRNNGAIVWSTLAGPGSAQGGGIWGAATDGKRVYTNISNAWKKTFVLAPSNQTTTAGGWVALDPPTGNILWTTANPSSNLADGPVTVVNDVVIAGSVDPTGPVYGMNAATGKVIWSSFTNATVYGGASSSYGCIYIGNGYRVGPTSQFHPAWTGGKYVYCYCI
ncbi:hypothetical protein M569_12846, partial [Genlisea aurea]